MKEFLTNSRLDKITNAVKSRQHSLYVVLENIHDPHNVSAIYRSCDAVGVARVGLLYTVEEFPRISKVSSASAMKWIETDKYKSVDECYKSLRSRNFKIYATMLDETAESIYNLDLTENIAIVMGNEHRGVSEEAAEKADINVFIPMRGMIQSLNVSVATAVTLFEAQRQREIKGMYTNNGLSEQQINDQIDVWANK